MNGNDPAAFDQYASNYDEALGRGLSLTGEGKEYFAEGRVKWLRRVLSELNIPTPRKVLDYGCGTGSGAPWLINILGCESTFGYDPSAESIAEAKKVHAALPSTFSNAVEDIAPGAFDLAFCNGVFHHIPIADRLDAARTILRALKPGGVFAFWENNPWNPIVHWMMWKVPFDHDAIMLFPAGAKRLLREAGFSVIDRDYQFVFPAWLSSGRKMEPSLRKLPLGGQYQILARKPL
jgi:SAM-dependent methyltransferase